MAAAPRPSRELPPGFVRLVASERLRADPARVAQVLATDPPWSEWRREAVAPDGLRRYALDLRMRLGGEGASVATFSKAAYVDLGMPQRTDAGWEVEIGWRASSAAPLFPVFSGTLRVSRDELQVDGVYAPPGGVIGRVADRMLLHLAANGTARWLLREIDSVTLTGKVGDESTAGG